MIWLKQRLDAAREPDDITVVSFQDSLFSFVLYLDHVYGSDLPCLWTEAVEVANHFFLVWDGDVKPAKLRVCVEDFGQLLNGRNLVVLVNGVYVLILELLVEITYLE